MINVIGLGYIGLPSALMLASKGIEVVGTDHNVDLVEDLNRGCVAFKEEGLETLFTNALKYELKFSIQSEKAQMYIVAVPTPYNKVSRKIDAQYLIRAVKDILVVAPNEAVIIIESTVSPGTIDKYVRPIILSNNIEKNTNIHLVHAPERIIPGNMIQELVYNNRTIGADSVQIAEKVKKIYASFCKGEIYITDIRTAEMSKVVENTFRDINIAYANELAKICRSDNLNVYEIIEIANKHPRVNILTPGPGVGGHCISVDPWFLVGDYPGLANLVLTARNINDSMPEFVLNRIVEIMKKHNIEKADRVGIYGLTYKEDVDDVRESPTLQLLENMDKHLAGNIVKVYDPYVEYNIISNQYHNLDEFLSEIDIIVLMVGHSEIKSNFSKLQNKIILDTRKSCPLEGTYYL